MRWLIATRSVLVDVAFGEAAFGCGGLSVVDRLVGCAARERYISSASLSCAGGKRSPEVFVWGGGRGRGDIRRSMEGSSMRGREVRCRQQESQELLTSWNGWELERVRLAL